MSVHVDEEVVELENYNLKRNFLECYLTLFVFFVGVLVVVNSELVSIGLAHICGLLLTWTSHVHRSLFPKKCNGIRAFP